MISDDDYEYFELKEEHVALLRRTWVGWQDCETGAPEIDPKRPYGNSNVASDVAKILGVKWEGEEMPPEIEDSLMAVHRETERALAVVLASGSFEPGRYRRKKYTGRWERVESNHG